MLVCIPTNGNLGLEDTVSDHFGSAPFFTLINTNDGAVTILENRTAHHDHGTCHPMTQLARHHIDCVVCAGMGRRAVETLNGEGIKTYLADGKTVSEIVAQMQSGGLTEIDPRQACRGHAQHSGEPHICPGHQN
jgi:predicted Fe-Mo cluster-binding NifX family protein